MGFQPLTFMSVFIVNWKLFADKHWSLDHTLRGLMRSNRSNPGVGLQEQRMLYLWDVYLWDMRGICIYGVKLRCGFLAS